MSELVFAIIGAACALIGAIGAYAAWQRNKSIDSSHDGENKGVILTEIGYIKSGVDDIKKHQSDQDERYMKLIQRVATVEQKADRANIRLDKVEKEIYDGLEKIHHLENEKE